MSHYNSGKLYNADEGQPSKPYRPPAWMKSRSVTPDDAFGSRANGASEEWNRAVEQESHSVSFTTLLKSWEKRGQ